jgi:hypothetical protein
LLTVALAACGTTTPPPHPLPALDDIVRTCAMDSSCLGAPLGNGGSNCIVFIEYGILSGFGAGDFTADELRRFVSCAASSADCATATACASRGHDAAYCAAHVGRHCDGIFLTDCPDNGDPAISNIDCSVYGERCVELNGYANCSDGTLCNAVQQNRHCEGNTFVYCEDIGLTARFDCDGVVEGGHCVDAGAMSGCAPSTPCTVASGCHGDLLVSCADGTGYSVDCAAMGGHCGAQGNTPTCVFSGCGADHCDGNSLVLCHGDQPVTIDCASIGLTSCSNAACH